jgi:hypothetical protein
MTFEVIVSYSCDLREEMMMTAASQCELLSKRKVTKHQRSDNVCGSIVTCRPALVRQVSDISIDSQISDEGISLSQAKKIQKRIQTDGAISGVSTVIVHIKSEEQDVLILPSAEQNRWIARADKRKNISIRVPQRSNSCQRKTSFSLSTMSDNNGDQLILCPTTETTPSFSYDTFGTHGVSENSIHLCRDRVPQIPMRRLSIISGS